MNLVERHIVKQNHSLYSECDRVCHLSKNLYNKANYIVRQEFISTSKEKQEGVRENAVYLNYHELRKQLITSDEYTSLPRKVSNQTLMLLDKNWRSFFASIKEYGRNKEKFLGRPKLPGYRKVEGGRYVTIYEKGALSIPSLREGVIKLSKTGIEFPTKVDEKQVLQVRIIPIESRYVIEVVYNREEDAVAGGDLIASIDSGVNNLATVAFNKKDVDSFIINGRPLKSINQYYNKKRAEMQSKLKKEQNRSKSKGLTKLTNKRNEKIKDYMHKCSTLLANQLAKDGVGTLVIGKNPGQKQDVNIGSKNNQNFVGLPIFRFLYMVSYKAKLRGINVVWQEESYTSKVSFFDGDHIPVYGEKEDVAEFSGYRESRGLYKLRGRKIRVNADLNGALNILRKAIPNGFSDGIEGIAVCPKRIAISA